MASLYRTTPISPIPQADFLNTAVVGECDLQPEQLLAVCKALEYAAGRRVDARHGPRPLDIDLLLHGNREQSRAELTLPHPRLRERAFYLAPLAEIAADLGVPPDGVTVGDLAAGVGGLGVDRRRAWRFQS